MANFFDLWRAEKKTIGFLADTIKKKVWMQEENPADNQA